MASRQRRSSSWASRRLFFVLCAAVVVNGAAMVARGQGKGVATHITPQQALNPHREVEPPMPAQGALPGTVAVQQQVPSLEQTVQEMRFVTYGSLGAVLLLLVWVVIGLARLQRRVDSESYAWRSWAQKMGQRPEVDPYVKSSLRETLYRLASLQSMLMRMAQDAAASAGVDMRLRCTAQESPAPWPTGSQCGQATRQRMPPQSVVAFEPRPSPQEVVEERRRREVEGLVRAYNQARDERRSFADFRRGRDCSRIGVVNFDRRTEANPPAPEFRDSPQGEYAAIRLATDGQFAVFPWSWLALQDVHFGPGAMAEVFDCPQYEPGNTYPNVRVVKAAIFSRAAIGGGWDLVEKGELNLGC